MHRHREGADYTQDRGRRGVNRFGSPRRDFEEPNIQGPNIQGLSLEETRRLVHELEIHQAKLERQNQELRQTQQELELARDRYADLFEFAPIGYVTQAETGGILEANLTAARLLGVERAGLVGKPFHHFLAKDHQDVYEQHRRGVFAGQGPQTCQVKVLRGDGTHFSAQIESLGIAEGEGKISKAWSVIIDVTERTRAEAALKASERRYQDLYDNAPDMYFTMGEDGTVLSVNLFGAECLGYTREELIGGPIWKVVHPDDSSQVEQQLAQAFELAPKVCELAFRKLRKDGSVLWVHEQIRSVTASAHGPAELRIICRDITERRRLELMRNRFFSIASHELRTPLTNMSISLELIGRDAAKELPVNVKSMIDIALRSSERLTRLVNEILDVQRFENGEMPLQVEPLDLMPLVVETIAANRAYAEQFGVRMVLVPALTGVKVRADSDRLTQVLTNLLSNAARFSPQDGTVVVAVMRRGSDVCVSVTDQGSGVPEDFREQVFEPFSQAETSLEDDRHKDSAGLGLSIAKAIVEGLGGRIGFETEPQVATTFYFELPEWRDDELGPTAVQPG